MQLESHTEEAFQDASTDFDEDARDRETLQSTLALVFLLIVANLVVPCCCLPSKFVILLCLQSCSHEV